MKKFSKKSKNILKKLQIEYPNLEIELIEEGYAKEIGRNNEDYGEDDYLIVFKISRTFQNGEVLSEDYCMFDFEDDEENIKDFIEDSFSRFEE